MSTTKKDAKQWLYEYLVKNGEVDCEVVKAKALAAGYSKTELREARILCKIEPLARTFWRLPDRGSS